jgi:hypothetical protein
VPRPISSRGTNCGDRVSHIVDPNLHTGAPLIAGSRATFCVRRTPEVRGSLATALIDAPCRVRPHAGSPGVLTLSVILCDSAASDDRWVLAGLFGVVLIEWSARPASRQVAGAARGVNDAASSFPRTVVAAAVADHRRRGPLREVCQYPTVVGMPRKATPP